MIFIIGYHASGKSHIARLVSDRFNMLHAETSAIVKGFKKSTHPNMPMGEWVELIEKEYGADFFDSLIAREVVKMVEDRIRLGVNPSELVITGNRELAGVQYLINYLSTNHIIPSLRQTIIAVHTNPEIMYERYKSRNRYEGDSQITREEYERIMQQERDIGLQALFEAAEYHINNDFDEDKLILEVENLFYRDIGLIPNSHFRDWKIFPGGLYDPENKSFDLK